MTKPLPVLGAALTLDMLALHRNWVLEHQRDVEIQSFASPQWLSGDMTPRLDRAGALLDGHTGRRTLHGPFLGFQIDAADPEVAEVVRRRMLACLDACVALKADQMVIHSPVTTWDHSNQMWEPAQALIQTERVRYVMGPVIKRAEETGITMVLENVEDVDPYARVRLAEALKSPAVAVSLDTGHADYARRLAGAPPVDVFVAAAGKRLSHVHLQDTDGYADRHWHPGEGLLAWRPVFAALSRLPVMPRLILEVNDERGLPKGAAHLAAMGLAV
ncbi:MAG: sugar phosphate isomerase/epimerase family protein [Gemmobacter sp.]